MVPPQKSSARLLDVYDNVMQQNTSTPSSRAETGRPGASPPTASIEADIEDLARRTGADVFRLESAPTRLVAELLASGVGEIRLPRAFAAVTSESPMAAAEFDGDRAVFHLQSGRLESKVERWSYVYLAVRESTAGRLVFFDRTGTELFELHLTADGLERLGASLPKLEHTEQRPHEPEIQAGQTVIHDRSVDLDSLVRYWRQPGRSHRSLQRAFRLDRRELIEKLPDRYATTIELARARGAWRQFAASRSEVQFRIEIESPKTRFVDTTREFDVVSAGRSDLLTGPDWSVLVDAARAESAALVRRPTESGLQSFLEVLDTDGNAVLRLRTENGTTASERFAWRARIDGCRSGR